MSNKIIKADFDNGLIQFTQDGWFNATVAAARFGKFPHEWLRLPETIAYIAAMDEANQFDDLAGSTCGIIPYVKTSKARADRGGGTWLHPDLAVAFARWLDMRFSVWCDRQIKALIRGDLAPADLAPAKQHASAAFRHMCDVLQTARKAQGKETHSHHYQNEAKLIDFAVTGHFNGVDRAAITSKTELGLFEAVEIRNGALIAVGKSRDERKAELVRFVAERRAKALARLSA